jgi:hypothetical protein
MIIYIFIVLQVLDDRMRIVDYNYLQILVTDRFLLPVQLVATTKTGLDWTAVAVAVVSFYNKKTEVDCTLKHYLYLQVSHR